MKNLRGICLRILASYLKFSGTLTDSLHGEDSLSGIIRFLAAPVCADSTNRGRSDEPRGFFKQGLANLAGMVQLEEMFHSINKKLLQSCLVFQNIFLRLRRLRETSGKEGICLFTGNSEDPAAGLSGGNHFSTGRTHNSQ